MQLHFALLSIGTLLLIGLVADVLGRRTHIPRVTLLMLVGVMIGPVGLDILPPELEQWYEFLTSAALTMVAFLLGGALSVAKLKSHGREIVIVSIAVAAWRGYPPRPRRRRRWTSFGNRARRDGSRASSWASSLSMMPGR
jgi:Kef-type K+ transport system membrane component KefB